MRTENKINAVSKSLKERIQHGIDDEIQVSINQVKKIGDKRIDDIIINSKY